MESYNSIYNHHTLANAKKDIDYVKGRLNAAYNAVERHANSWRKNNQRDITCKYRI